VGVGLLGYRISNLSVYNRCERFASLGVGVSPPPSPISASNFTDCSHFQVASRWESRTSYWWKTSTTPLIGVSMPSPSPSNAGKTSMPFMMEIWPFRRTPSEDFRSLEQRTFFAGGRSPLDSKERLHCEGQRATGRSLTSKDNKTRQCPLFLRRHSLHSRLRCLLK
jgi:hypothetical protein